MVDAVKELAGKVAIVTGSARNIGRATAVELARAGASVTVAARSAGDLCRAAAAEIEAEGGRAMAHVGDLADPVRRLGSGLALMYVAPCESNLGNA